MRKFFFAFVFASLFLAFAAPSAMANVSFDVAVSSTDCSDCLESADVWILSGDATTAIYVSGSTDATGNFVSRDVDSADADEAEYRIYYVLLSKDCCSFTPASRSVTVSSLDTTDQSLAFTVVNICSACITPTPTLTPTLTPTVTVTPTTTPYPEPTNVPEPTPSVTGGTPTGTPTPIASTDLPPTGEPNPSSLSLTVDEVQALLGASVDKNLLQVVKIGDGATVSYTTTTGGTVIIEITSQPTEVNGVIYRWVRLVWNPATSQWTITGLNTSSTTMISTASDTLRLRLTDGGTYDIDGTANGTLVSKTANMLLAAQKPAAPTVTTTPTVYPTMTPSSGPHGGSSGGCSVGSLWPMAVLLMPLVLLMRKK